MEDHTTEQELGAWCCPVGVTLEPSESNMGVSTFSEFFFFSERASITEVERGDGGFSGKQAGCSNGTPLPPISEPTVRPLARRVPGP